MLRVQVLSGALSDELVNRLRAHDPAGLVAVTLVDRPGLAAVVIATGHYCTGERAADVVLDDGQPLAAQIDRLWAERIAPFARHMAGITPMKVGAPCLHPHDPGLLATGRRLLDRLRDALRERGLDNWQWTYDHIGSTAVPGLRAKRFIDLQIGADSLTEQGSPTDEVLAAAGFLAATGSRPDSPGVYRDRVIYHGLAPDEAYRKRLYFRVDPAQPAILHVRKPGWPRSAGCVTGSA